MADYKYGVYGKIGDDIAKKDRKSGSAGMPRP